MAAGYATKTKTLGMLEGFPIPNVLWDVNAFALGAQAANPGTVVHVAYMNAWSDPVKEAQTAAAMIAQGADVIATDMDTAAALVVAEKEGKYAVGYEVDMAKSAPHGILTSVEFHWGQRLVPMVRQMQAGTWTSAGTPLYGISTGVVDDAKIPAHPRRRHCEDRGRAPEDHQWHVRPLHRSDPFAGWQNGGAGRPDHLGR